MLIYDMSTILMERYSFNNKFYNLYQIGFQLELAVWNLNTEKKLRLFVFQPEFFSIIVYC